MLYRYFIFIFCLMGPAPIYAEELHLLQGKKITGELLGINDQSITMQIDGKPVTTSVDQALLLNLHAPNTTKPQHYRLVELTDGSLFQCSQFAAQGKDAKLTLFNGYEIKLPLSSITYVMAEAQDENLRNLWKAQFHGKKLTSDIVVIKIAAGAVNQANGAKADDKLSCMEGTFFDASDDGKMIDFAIKDSNDKVPLEIAKIHGMYFLRMPDPNAPSFLCKIYDVSGNSIMAHSVSLDKANLTIETISGVKVVYPRENIARLDYSRGKIVYLSDMELNRVKVVENSIQGRIEHFRRDKNLDDGPLRLRGITYGKGLSIHAYTDLTFELEGEYREFTAMVGVDDLVDGNNGPTVLTIEGDGRQLRQITVTRMTAPMKLVVNVKDVQRLRIVVSSGDKLKLDFGRHLDLADAKISK